MRARNTVILRIKFKEEVNAFRTRTIDLNTFISFHADDDATASQHVGIPADYSVLYSLLQYSSVVFVSGIRGVGLLMCSRTEYQEPGNVPSPRKLTRAVAYERGPVRTPAGCQ